MKTHKIPLLLLTLAMLAGCGPQNGGSSNGNASNSDGSEEKYETEEDKMYQKLWEAKTIYNESCVMIEGTDGIKSARLVYKPTEILEVRNATLQKVYGKDEYRIEGDRIIMTESSTMPFLTQANVAGTDVPDSIGGTHESTKVPSGKILFTEGVGIIMYQIAVTYKTNENWYGTVPERKGERLPKLQQKLANHEDITFVCNGDSIFTGCNSSGVKGIEPFLDPFPTGFASELERKYGSTVTLHNTAVGGMMSDWGRKNVEANINQFTPDLVLIGFGMNDGCGAFRVPVTDYIANIEFMVQSIQSTNPDAEIILAATIVANPDSPQAYMQEQYLEPLLELEDGYDGVAVLDMTTYSKDLLQKKNSLELYANNINHPCDFMVRGYVSNLMHLVEVKK